MQKITLVSHTDTLTGAPKLLIDIADLLFEQGYHITFVVKYATNSGLLDLRRHDFKILKLKQYKTSFLGRVLNVFSQKMTYQKFINLLKQSDIVINNTSDNADLIPYYNKYASKKVISYLHELDAVIEILLPTKDLKDKLVAATAHFIVPSNYTKNRLIQKLAIQDEKVSILSYKIPDKKPKNGSLKIDKKEGEFWVGMCGTADARKGADIFVRIAEVFKLKYPTYNIKLVWLGFEGDSAKLIEEDIRKLNLNDTIHLIPRTLYPESFFETIDVFALTSREDPYPLVVLSAANAGKPIICFEQSGGIIDFVEEDCGFLVPFLDIGAYCEKIIHLYNQPTIRHKLGMNAKKKLAERHQKDTAIMAQLNFAFQKIAN